MTAPARAGADRDFGTPAFQLDPYPVYAALRAQGHLVHSTVHRTWFATDHAAAGAVLRDRRSSVESPFRATRVLFGRTVTDVEGEEHVRLRALTNRSFSASMIPGYLDDLVPAAVRGVLDDLDAAAGDGPADYVTGFANAVPIRVMSRIIGLRPADVPQFQSCSDAVIAFIDSADPVRRRAAVAAWARMRALLHSRVAELRPAPDDSVIGQLLSSAAEGADVDDDEIVRQVGLLIPAAIDTSNRLIANVLHTLCARPELMAQVAEDGNLVEAVVDETLRYEAPIHSTIRIWGGGELLGQDIPKGSLLTVLLGSANRDPAVFPDPDTFDPGRPGNQRLLSFGAGRHQCMGRRMALAEVTTALRLLLERRPGLRFADATPSPVQGLSFRSPATLRLAFGRRP
ncbi:cytochrome P450 [Micromonospora lupini]|uniref:Cytochrome P-450 hydroxylase n=1 Tax=Micromonospora lupini str. Lupac 08 TaxID=1150864 RepID=I0L269_9ACTN|nr:cytochrome P450 [Micromonospora lupini]CCH17916.1 Cytochrome P-450 hydroxylase [Micromonospora lupini str. Lupac 08]